MTKQHHRSLVKTLTVLGAFLLVGGGLTGCGSSADSKTSEQNQDQSSSVMHKNKTAAHNSSASQSSSTNSSSAATQQRSTTTDASILKRLVSYTNKESAGPTQNYYWDNGRAHITGFSGMKAGSYHFSADSQGRSATAKAVLTYSEYKASQGSRQGDPLEPPAWPSSNPIVAINFSLTGRTYHGYLYNRSHSIADSLLGAKSYTSAYNFTTGTRPQNVGADQDGGMRAAEETAEGYWQDHPNSSQTIDYETTPLYQGSETMPRGSIVDIKSSDNVINKEFVVINSVEGIKVNYNTGSTNAKTTGTTSHGYGYHSSYRSSAASSSSTTTSQSTAGATKSGKWTVAPAGKVYVSDSKKYYTKVINPANYDCVTKSQAAAEGATQAIRGNQYAQP
ncbi:DNA/RNA non-specific endonuclease [Secundilactobacillus paracollinoides]|uniref:DNA/RNA non-specific endonuclease n=2 Tax=Secundilactobacillus paracollinoides TaxID=240427 RepID=UPI00081A3815|nr:DNA/RNA non-specific endonuclease [Secundilactobacillus paracollinoides]ANZ60564.1 deoxyribonuclease [Secundilactobacillus paracollinoides]